MKRKVREITIEKYSPLFLEEVDSKESERSSCIFHDGKLYVIGLSQRSRWGEISSSGNLLMLDMGKYWSIFENNTFLIETLKWTKLSTRKNFSRNRMTLVGYNGAIYLFLGGNFLKGAETRISGLYRYDQGKTL